MFILIFHRNFDMNKITENISANEYLASKGKELINDKNILSKSIAAFIRNQIENFHANHLSDDEMKELNPLIRNAVYSYIIDYDNKFIDISNDESVADAFKYLYMNTFGYLNCKEIPREDLNDFYMTIKDCLYITFNDLENGAIMLAGYSIFYVPEYWEDCVYNNSLKQGK